MKEIDAAIEALEESIDLVRHAYETDWRHGIPTRKAQLDGIKKQVDDHEAALAGLRSLKEQEPVGEVVDAAEFGAFKCEFTKTLPIGTKLFAHPAPEAKQTKQVVENFDELKQEPVLQDIEQYRMQMAGISTAALGYWKEGDSIHPDYDTPALRDVAKLYAQYAELRAKQEQT